MSRQFSRKKRDAKIRKPKPLIVIIAEGKNVTETNYFKSFQNQFAAYNIKILSVGHETDPKNMLELDNKNYPNYYIKNLDNVVVMLKKYIDKLIAMESKQKGVLIINGVDDLVKNVYDIKLLEELTDSLRKYENIGTILVETNNKFKFHSINQWVKNISNSGNGIWIGNGVGNQNAIICTVSRGMNTSIEDDMGYVITDNNPELCKLLNFDEEK